MLAKNPVIFLFIKVWEYSRGNRHRLLLYLILSIIANAVGLINPLVVAEILSIIQEGGVTKETLGFSLVLIALLPLLNIIFWALHGPARVLERKNAFFVRANYKRYLLAGVMDLPAEWHTDHHSGDTIDKISKGTEALYNFADGTFMVISLVVPLVGSYIALMIFNIHAAYIVLAMVVVTAYIVIKFDRILVDQYKELNQSENKISEKVYDTISNITTVIILRIERLILKTLNKQLMQPYPVYKSNITLNEWKWFLVSVATTLMIFFVLMSYMVSTLYSGGIILVGVIYALYSYVEKINNGFYEFTWQYSSYVRMRSSVANAEEISLEFKKKRLPKAIELKNWDEIEIKNLQFSYQPEEGAEKHLDGVTLTIRRGERIAIIGESGSGKSTFLKLFRDLYHPNYVEVRKDGELLPHGFKSIREDIALIPQDPEIFTSTILENITLGVPYDIEEVKKYTDMACFTDVVSRLPKKWDSSIVEKGVNLSGGEKQRLALSRGLLACEDKEIVLLDEPTSSVDSKNELTIYENIFEQFSDKTIISTIHRLHLLKLFDQIYLFSNGQILSHGSFEELLKKSKEFKALWAKYSKIYKEEIN